MKLNIFLIVILLLFAFACKKETIFPKEYDYIIGEWVLSEYSIKKVQNTPFEITKTYPSDSLSYIISLLISKSEISEMIENTNVLKSKKIKSVSFENVSYSGGNSSMEYNIMYKTQKPFEYNSIILNYDIEKDIITQLHSVNATPYSDFIYIFTFKRNR